MATKEELTAKLKAIGEERRAIGEEIKQASSAATLAAPKLVKSVTTKTIASIVTKMGGRADVHLEMVDGKLEATVKTAGSGGTKSPSRSRAANVSTWFVNGKDIESAMPSKVIKAIGEDYGADSPERWLDKNVSKLAKVDAVVDGKRIKAAEFIKAHPVS